MFAHIICYWPATKELLSAGRTLFIGQKFVPCPTTFLTIFLIICPKILTVVNTWDLLKKVFNKCVSQNVSVFEIQTTFLINICTKMFSLGNRIFAMFRTMFRKKTVTFFNRNLIFSIKTDALETCIAKNPECGVEV